MVSGGTETEMGARVEEEEVAGAGVAAEAEGAEGAFEFPFRRRSLRYLETCKR